MILTPHIHRRLLLSTALGAALLTIALDVTAKSFEVPADPTDFKQIQEQVASKTGKIAQYLTSDAQCGGWNATESVNARKASQVIDPNDNTNPGKIAKVTGAPGHLGDPYGNYRSGLASRIETGGEPDNPKARPPIISKNDGFLFPDSTVGLSTACKPMVRDEHNSNRVLKIQSWTGYQRWVDYPYFEDPSCKWQFSNDSRGGVEPSTGTGVPMLGASPSRDLSPQSCNDFCKQLNDPMFTWMDCKIPLIDPESGAIIGCQKEEPKWTCTDEWVVPDAGQESFPNCRICQGRECRCDGKYVPPGTPPGAGNGCKYTPVAVDPKPSKGQLNYMPYGSFYRQYAVQSLRDTLTEVPNDKLAYDTSKDKGTPITLPVACYGFYSEFDTKTHLIEGKDRRCVINFPFTKKDLQNSQKGMATYQTNPTTSPDMVRKNRDGSYDDKDTLWYKNLGGSFSLLSEQAFEKEKNDLNLAFLSIDSIGSKGDVAMQQAAYQKSTVDPLTNRSTLRAFDDSVFTDRTDPNAKGNPSSFDDTRAITRWWQQLETDAYALLSPPTVRLRLPSTSALSGKLASLVDTSKEAIDAQLGDPRMKSIDVQVHAEDDLLGQVSSYLQDSLLLKIEEEPVPVVVPLLSAVELRALRERWCSWALQHYYYQNPPKSDDAGKTCDEVASPEVKHLLQRLEEYAVSAEQVRALRAELPSYIGGIITHQQQVLVQISTWVKDNLETYKVFLKNRAIRLQLASMWKEVQKQYTTYHDETDLPWCRNDRFTTPIYSLLPQPPKMIMGTPSCQPGAGLPLLCPPTGEKDLVLDLSTLKLLTGAVKLPVLKPVQLRLSVPTPPPADQDLTDEDKTAIELPELPPVPSLTGKITIKLPEVAVLSAPKKITPPPPITQGDFIRMWTALNSARSFLQQLNDLTKEFWKSLEPNDLTKNLTCKDWNTTECTHVEMDLLERVTRIMARPGILLQEDLGTTGVSRLKVSNGNEKAANCDPNDQACLELLPQQTLPKDGWQMIAPKQPDDAASASDQLQQLRNDLRQETITDNGKIRTGKTLGGEDKELPFISQPQDIFPIFWVPSAFDLRPLPPPPPAPAK